MIVKATVGIYGEYRVEKLNKGDRTFDSGWFPNLITNNGLNLMATSANRVQEGFVGTGNTTPAVTDVSLANFLASDTSNFGTFTSIDTTDNYVFFIRQYEFSEGTATGNISELGVGPAQNNLFSRALIVDELGSPTTITVLSDEVLRFSYRLRIYQPLIDFASTVDGYDIVLRAADIDVAAAWSDDILNIVSFSSASGNYTETNGFTGSISDVTSNPTGTAFPRTSVSTDAYVDNSHEITGELFWDTGQGNGTLSSFYFHIEGMGSWQFSVAPAIEKSSAQRLRIYPSIRWAREGELPT